MVVADVENFPLLDRVRSLPQVFTPNGDGVNDQARSALPSTASSGDGGLTSASTTCLAGRCASFRCVGKTPAAITRSLGWSRRCRGTGATGNLSGARRFRRRCRWGKNPDRELGGGGLLTERRTAWLAGVLACCALRALAVEAQSADASRWGLQGPPVTAWEVPHFELEYITPRMHRWYAPRHLVESYMQPWYGGDRTSYALRTLPDPRGHWPRGRTVVRHLRPPHRTRLDGLYLGTRANQARWQLDPPRTPYWNFFHNLVIASDEAGEPARG